MSTANATDGQRRLVANKPVEVALNEIVTRARVFTDAGGAAIALRDGDYLITRASSGNIAPDVGARNAVEGSLTGQAVLKGVPIHIEDSDKDPRVDADVCRQLNTRSFIVTPIAGSTTMLGVLAVFASTPNAFTRTDLAVLRTMADQIATALGGGSFIQQVWPSENSAEASDSALPMQSEPEPVREAPEPPRYQAQKEAPRYESPRREQPKFETPKAEPVRQKPAIADVQFESLEQHADLLESDPIVIPEKVRNRENAPAKQSVRVAPVAERAKSAPIPRVEQEPVREEIEPIAQPTEESRVKMKPVAPARPVKVSGPAPVTKKEPPKHEQSSKMKADEGVSLDEIIDARAKSVDPIGGRKEKSAVRAETGVAERKETVEWKGLSVEQEPESSSTKKIIIGVVAALVVVGAVGAGIMLKKSPAKAAQQSAVASTSAAAAPVSTATTPATTSATTPSATTAASPAASTSQSRTPTTSTPTTAASPAAKPAQPGIVIASGGSPRQNQAVEDQAPPQLAFSGGAPQLPGASAAMPKRAASDPTPAQVMRRVTPTYPDIARRQRQRGAVELQAAIRKDGTVGKIDVVSGPMLLRQAAIDAVKQWRYRPAQLSGIPVESTVRVTVDFTNAQ